MSLYLPTGVTDRRLTHEQFAFPPQSPKEGPFIGSIQEDRVAVPWLYDAEWKQQYSVKLCPRKHDVALVWVRGGVVRLMMGTHSVTDITLLNIYNLHNPRLSYIMIPPDQIIFNSFLATCMN